MQRSESSIPPHPHKNHPQGLWVFIQEVTPDLFFKRLFVTLRGRERATAFFWGQEKRGWRIPRIPSPEEPRSSGMGAGIFLSLLWRRWSPTGPEGLCQGRVFPGIIPRLAPGPGGDSDGVWGQRPPAPCPQQGGRRRKRRRRRGRRDLSQGPRKTSGFATCCGELIAGSRGGSPAVPALPRVRSRKCPQG